MTDAFRLACRTPGDPGILAALADFHAASGLLLAPHAIPLHPDDADWDACLAPLEWLRPLRSDLGPPSAPVPDDAFEFAAEAVRDGRAPWCLPVRIDVTLLHYRSDLLDEPRERDRFRELNHRELAIPNDWAQFALAAHHFTRPPQLYGAAFPGSAAGLSRFLEEVVVSLGGRLTDGRGGPELTTREGEAAATLLSDLLLRWEVAPPGLLDMDETSARDCFRRGNAAMAVLGPAGFRRLTDTSFSAVAGWLALAPLPGGRAERRRSFPTLWGLGLRADSPRRATGERLAAYLLSDVGQEALATDAGCPARRGPWQAIADPLREGTLAHRRWHLFRVAIDEAARPWPVVEEPQWSEVIGPALRRMIEEQQDPRAAVRAAQAALETRSG